MFYFDPVLNALKANTAVPAFNVPYLPMVEPVVRAVVDLDSFALIETARLEWYKFQARSAAAVAASTTRSSSRPARTSADISRTRSPSGAAGGARTPPSCRSRTAR